jgi:hypothetical protein
VKEKENISSMRRKDRGLDIVEKYRDKLKTDESQRTEEKERKADAKISKRKCS